MYPLSRRPSIEELRKTIQGEALFNAEQELEETYNGGDFHEHTYELLKMPLEELPEEIEHKMEPHWLFLLHQAIIKHRFMIGD